MRTDTLAECIILWNLSAVNAEQQLSIYQRQADDLAFWVYGVEGEDRRAVAHGARGQEAEAADDEGAIEVAEEEAEIGPAQDEECLAADLLSYAIGSALGRWDVRFATGERPMPELPNPFAPLPACSPGMLTDGDSLPLREAPPGYPLRFTLDGILVDDPGPDRSSPHHDDIVRRVREVLELVWGERAEAIEREACEILGVEELRDYFRNPRAFFDDHIKRYSKSRRKAPIYWLLQSAKRSYGLWLYYHRLDRDTVFKALRHYVEPKIKEETSRLREMKARLDAGKESMARRERTQVEKEVERQDALITELGAFKEALERVAALGYDPDLNDGVVLNIAPFHELTPWKEAKVYWDELRTGRYEWSTMSQRLKAVFGHR
jgi:hypothetical protein